MLRLVAELSQQQDAQSALALVVKNRCSQRDYECVRLHF